MAEAKVTFLRYTWHFPFYTHTWPTIGSSFSRGGDLSSRCLYQSYRSSSLRVVSCGINVKKKKSLLPPPLAWSSPLPKKIPMWCDFVLREPEHALDFFFFIFNIHTPTPSDNASPNENYVLIDKALRAGYFTFKISKTSNYLHPSIHLSQPKKNKKRESSRDNNTTHYTHKKKKSVKKKKHDTYNLFDIYTRKSFSKGSAPWFFSFA